MANVNSGMARYGPFRKAFEANRKKIIASQSTCGICGEPVNKRLKYPHPLSATVDHIVPVSRGGHPAEIENLQLAHWTCNRQKSDKLQPNFLGENGEDKCSTNSELPWSFDWEQFRA